MVHITLVLSIALAVATSVHGVALDPRRYQKGGHNKGGDMNGGGCQAGAVGQAGAAKTGKAIYFMTNKDDNSIVALPISKDGKLADGSITATGGKGGIEVDPKTGLPTLPDGIASEGAVRVASSHVFAVNPGSNSVSMFAVDDKDPTKLTMVGQPADTLGEFPVTMAVSAKNKLVCVANTGAKAGVACAKMDAQAGIGKMDALRPFELSQQTPPTRPLNSVAGTFFNAEETALLKTVKGDPAVNNTGFLSAFAVEDGALSMKETRSSPAGTAVLFGTVNIPGSHGKLLATDASFGAAIVAVGADLKASVAATLPIGNQNATCWATVSKSTGTGFVTDVAVNHLIEMDVETGALVEQTDLTTTNPGMIDLESSGDFVYALSPGNANVTSAVAVFDVSGGKRTAKQIQNFNPKGVDLKAQGMAVMN